MPLAPERRESDSPDESHLPKRDGSGELRLAWGNWSIGVRGPFVISVLLLLGLGAGLFWMNYLNVLAHGDLLRAIHLQTCITSLSSEEKLMVREAAKQSQTRFTDTLHYLCPYLRPPTTASQRSFPLTTGASAATMGPSDASPASHNP